MPVIEVNGVVTREVRYGENSRILTVLAEDAGENLGAGRTGKNQPFGAAHRHPTGFILQLFSV